MILLFCCVAPAVVISRFVSVFGFIKFRGFGFLHVYIKTIALLHYSKWHPKRRGREQNQKIVKWNCYLESFDK